jgi:hypothetical protein
MSRDENDGLQSRNHVWSKIEDYFDLYSKVSDAPYVPGERFFNGLGQWFALFSGIMIEPYFQKYQETHQWIWTGISGWTLFALITSYVIFPAIYKNAFDPDKPVIVQLAPIFTAGLGWHTLLSTAIKAVK